MKSHTVLYRLYDRLYLNLTFFPSVSNKLSVVPSAYLSGEMLQKCREFREHFDFQYEINLFYLYMLYLLIFLYVRVGIRKWKNGPAAGFSRLKTINVGGVTVQEPFVSQIAEITSVNLRSVDRPVYPSCGQSNMCTGHYAGPSSAPVAFPTTTRVTVVAKRPNNDNNYYFEPRSPLRRIKEKKKKKKREKKKITGCCHYLTNRSAFTASEIDMSPAISRRKE